MWAYWKRLYERLRDNIVGNTSQESFVYVSTAILSRLSYTEIVKIAAMKNVSAALKIHQNAFVAGACPGPRWWSVIRLGLPIPHLWTLLTHCPGTNYEKSAPVIPLVIGVRANFF